MLCVALRQYLFRRLNHCGATYAPCGHHVRDGVVKNCTGTIFIPHYRKKKAMTEAQFVQAMQNKHKFWIDNARILCIWLLFPFHAAMIFNAFGEGWYILSTPSKAASILNFSTYPWWMSGLFLLAGISAFYSLHRRNVTTYVKERVCKLLIPLVAGLVLLVPIQAYLADKFHKGYEGSYWDHLSIFFSITDFSGYDGAFSPAHLWFILYLFIISLVSLPIIFLVKKFGEARDKNNPCSNRPFAMKGIGLILLGIIPPIIEPLGDIGGKSVTEFLGWFLIGYFFISSEETQKRIKKKWLIWLCIFSVLFLIRAIYYLTIYDGDIFWGVTNTLYRWFGILTLIALGQKFLDRKFCFTTYFSKAAFPFYIFHQSFIVIAGYFACQTISSPLLQYIVIMLSAFVLTFLTYELAKRIGITRFLFGIKR